MNLKQLMVKIRDNIFCKSYIPLSHIMLLPGITQKNSETVAEVFYVKSDNAKGPYTVYPVSYRVLYSLKDNYPVLMERIRLNDIDYNTPLGAYAQLMEESKITPEAQEEYAIAFDKAVESGTPEELAELSEMWNKIIPEKIRETIK